MGEKVIERGEENDSEYVYLESEGAARLANRAAPNRSESRCVAPSRPESRCVAPSRPESLL